MEKLKILFFAAWYPNRRDAMAGLFIRKHAEAVARKNDVCVLFPYTDDQTKHFEIVEQTTNGVKEIYVYYPESSSPIRKLIKFYYFLKAYYIGLKRVKKVWGKPHIVHANVLTRSGAMAYLLKLKYNIPYVVTEHWSRYLPLNFQYKGCIRKKVTELVVRNASKIMPVSESLKQAMWANGLKTNHYVVVPNVVDDFFYEQKKKTTREKKRILHVSCFSEPKNIEGIIDAIDLLSKKRQDFEIYLVGTGILFDKIKDKVDRLKLNDFIYFTGEVTPIEVKQWMDNSDFFVMFSNYETAGVVIEECWATGIPLISTNVGVISEDGNKGNCIIVPEKNKIILSENIELMLDNIDKYKSNKIKKDAIKYSYKNVQETLQIIYNKAIKGK